MNNSTIHTVTRRVSRKLLKYLLMSFVCDVIIGLVLRCHFPICMLFPHLYALEEKPSEIVLQKVIFSYVRAIFLFTSILSLPQKISLEVGFSKPNSGYSHFFKHV